MILLNNILKILLYSYKLVILWEIRAKMQPYSVYFHSIFRLFWIANFHKLPTVLQTMYQNCSPMSLPGIHV